MSDLPLIKDGVNPKAWDYIHPMAKEIFEYCEITFDKMGGDCVITSMIRPKLDDSGIHATGRALDFVVRPRENGRKLSPKDHVKFSDYLCLIFIRKVRESRAVLFHDVGLGYHYHIQVDKTADWTDLNGSLPEGAGPTEKPISVPADT